MITFAAICPHPRILLKKIGTYPQRKKMATTIESLQLMGTELQAVQPKTVVVISPHGPITPRAFGINQARTLRASEDEKGKKIDYEYENDLELGQAIAMAAGAQDVEPYVFDAPIDYGVFVPLRFLLGKNKIQVLHLSIAFSSLEELYQVGKIIGQVCDVEKKDIAVVASADLSHCLTKDAPAGFSPIGEQFDRQLIRWLEEKKTQEVISLDSQVITQAAECGVRPIVMLLGVMDGNYNTSVFSYEGPLGIGMLVARLK